MSDLAELEARIGALEDIEAIKKLKSTYSRCLDGKLWDKMEDCFTDDVKTSYFNDEIKTDGKEATMQFFRMGLIDDIVAVHHAHQPEIELTSQTTARGTWALYNFLIDKKGDRAQRVGGIYHEEYVKIDGKWKMKSVICRQLFHESWERKDIPSAQLAFRGTPQYAATP
ncbi:MAG: nuclear transport factor 2 family protein [Dehalococcoidia bacterium]